MQKTTIVVPCYNEEKRLKVAPFRDFVAKEPRVDFLFVNDGSTDGTRQVLAEFRAERPNAFRSLDLERNSGKAEAVRRGVLEAARIPDVELIGYWDADLAAPLDALPKFAALFSNPDLMLVMGSRVQLIGHHIERSPLRHYIGRAFATLAAYSLALPVYDTQCGAKLFRAVPTMISVFELPFELNWCFDMEMLARLLRLEASNALNVRRQCVELPLEYWVDAPGSKINLKQAPRIAGELLRLAAIVRRQRRA